MSYHRDDQLTADRDRSQSAIRLSDRTTMDHSTRHEHPTPANNLLEFFQTLGLSSELIEALVNMNPQGVVPIQPQAQSQQPVINTLQDFAMFLCKSYELDSTVSSICNQSVNQFVPLVESQLAVSQDPRCRRIDHPTASTQINQLISIDIDSSANPNNNFTVSNTIDDLYKQYLSSIDHSSLTDDIRRKFQRINLLESELEKLHHMNIQLTKIKRRHSRRRNSEKHKDPLLRENEILEKELVHHVNALKATMMNNDSAHIFSNSKVH